MQGLTLPLCWEKIFAEINEMSFVKKRLFKEKVWQISLLLFFPVPESSCGTPDFCGLKNKIKYVIVEL